MPKLACLLVLPLAAAPALASGYRFRATTHAEGTSSAAISMADTVVAGRVDGPDARIEIEKSRNPLLPPGDVLVTRDGGKTFTRIDPARKVSSAWTPSGLATGRNAAAGSIVAVRFENPEVRKLAESPGEKIGGFSTRYFKLRIAYVTDVDVMGSVTKTATTRVEELWTAPALTDSGFAAWLRKDSASTGNEELDRRISQEISAVPGTPLKRVTTTTWTDPSGKDQTVKTTISVSDLAKMTASPDLFKVPPGFRDPSAQSH
ncbi:MAG: hypothetical protein ACRD16_17325 [Thermoanaerobaculia bacterium]